MNWFNKLPGSQTTPYGLEWRVLRLLPQITLAGTALPVLMAMLARLLITEGSADEIAHRLMTFDFLMIGIAVFVWTAALTVGIACVIVWLMKGPAYVADAYEVSHSDQPRQDP